MSITGLVANDGLSLFKCIIVIQAVGVTVTWGQSIPACNRYVLITKCILHVVCIGAILVTAHMCGRKKFISALDGLCCISVLSITGAGPYAWRACIIVVRNNKDAESPHLFLTHKVVCS